MTAWNFDFWFFFIFCISHYSGVLGRSWAWCRMCAFIMELTHCHLRQRGSAAPTQPTTCPPCLFSCLPLSWRNPLHTLPVTVFLQPAAFSIGFSPLMGDNLHLMHPIPDAENSRTLDPWGLFRNTKYEITQRRMLWLKWGEKTNEIKIMQTFQLCIFVKKKKKKKKKRCGGKPGPFHFSSPFSTHISNDVVFPLYIFCVVNGECVFFSFGHVYVYIYTYICRKYIYTHLQYIQYMGGHFVENKSWTLLVYL